MYPNRLYLTGYLLHLQGRSHVLAAEQRFDHATTRTINGLDLNDAEQLALLAQFNYRMWKSV
jgi:hypothetical protein